MPEFVISRKTSFKEVSQFILNAYFDCETSVTVHSLEGTLPVYNQGLSDARNSLIEDAVMIVTPAPVLGRTPDGVQSSVSVLTFMKK